MGDVKNLFDPHQGEIQATPTPPPAPPEMSEEEKALIQQQISLLQQAAAREEQFYPIMLSQMGYQVNPETGAIEQISGFEDQTAAMNQAQLDLLQQQLALGQQQMTAEEERYARAGQMEDFYLQSLGYARDPETGEISQIGEEQYYAGLNPMQKLAYDIQKEASQRQLSAYRGELEIDPQLERQIELGRNKLKEQLSRQLGPGWETSTAGIQAIQNYDKEAEMARYQIRHGEMTSGEAIAQSRGGQLAGGRGELQSQTYNPQWGNWANQGLGAYGGYQAGQQQFAQGMSMAPQQMASGYQMPLKNLSVYPLAGASELTNRYGMAGDIYGTKNQLLQGQYYGSRGGPGNPQSGCCFIFVEVNKGILDRIVRRYRDEHMTDRNRRGYYRIADRLVPLMRKSKFAKNVVKWLMTWPITQYGRYFYGESQVGVIFKPITKAWLYVFDLIGRNGPYSRVNGEIV